MGSILNMAWDDNVIIFLQKFMSDIMVKIAGIITEFGDATLLVGIVGLLYWSINKKLGKKLVVYLSFVNNIYPCIKSVVKRSRPYMLNSEIKCLKIVNKEGDINDLVSQGYSFPSGHACNSVAVYGEIARDSKKLIAKIGLVVFIILVGWSRLALGVHYPTDIIVGWIVSSICIAVYKLIENKLGRNKTFLLVDILCIAGFFIAKSNDFFTGYGMLIGATAGILFEEKFVNFKETKNILAVILRTVGGVGIYLALNTLLKMPFSEAFLNSGTLAAFCVRAARYAITVFVLIGVYPMLFKVFGKKNSK